MIANLSPCRGDDLPPKVSILCESDTFFCLPNGPLCASLPDPAPSFNPLESFSLLLPWGSKGHRCALTAPLGVSRDLSDPAKALKTSQRAAVSPTVWPDPSPSSCTTTTRLHAYQRAHSHPSALSLRLREEHGDLLDLCAIVRCSDSKDAWFFTFPQTTAQSSATRPGLAFLCVKNNTETTTPTPGGAFGLRLRAQHVMLKWPASAAAFTCERSHSPHNSPNMIYVERKASILWICFCVQLSRSSKTLHFLGLCFFSSEK